VIPQAGDIGLTVITGPLGWMIRVGQWASLDGAPYQHAFLVTDDDGGTIEAMPGRRGVRPNHADNYDPARTVYLRAEQSDDDRWEVARQGLALLGRRYSYAQYPALGLLAASEWAAKLTGKPKQELRPGWLLRYIADSRRVICSQTVDEAFVHARKVRATVAELFDDQRAPGDVSPGDLWLDVTAPHIRYNPYAAEAS
jgi:hypothetical protein